MLQQIVNHLWQSTLFAAVIGVLCLLLRRDGAHIRYWLWWAASVKFLIPFSMLIATGTWMAGDTRGIGVSQTWSVTAKAVTEPIAVSGSSSLLGPMLLGLWLVGSGAVLGYWLVRAARLRAVLRRADRDPNPLRANGVRVDIVRSDARVEPGVVGLFRNVLLLPRDLEARLTPMQLNAILAHEICHARRRDNLTASVHMFVEVAFWFHPLVWWIGARLIHERERACDERVIASGHDREAYAEGIINVCEHYAASPLRSAAGVGGSDLKGRITRIMRDQHMNSFGLTKKVLLGSAGAATLAVPLLAGLTVQGTVSAQEDACRIPTPPEDVFEQRFAAEGGYLPIVKVAPDYPVEAAERGLEGYVVLEYTVSTDGLPEDVTVTESSSSLFEAPAIESAQKYKYKPCVLNGEAIATPGVRTRVIFQIDGDEVPPQPGAFTGGDEVVVVTAEPLL